MSPKRKRREYSNSKGPQNKKPVVKKVWRVKEQNKEEIKEKNSEHEEWKKIAGKFEEKLNKNWAEKIFFGYATQRAKRACEKENKGSGKDSSEGKKKDDCGEIQELNGISFSSSNN